MPTVLKNIEKLTTVTLLENGFYICVLGTNKRPPHVAVIANGKYYSTSVKGLKNGIDYSNIMRTISRNNIPSLFIKVSGEIQQELLSRSFNSYPFLTPSISCLAPVREYFSQLEQREYTWQFIFDLIKDFQAENKISKTYHLYMDTMLKQQSFTLKTYSKQEIIKEIEQGI